MQPQREIPERLAAILKSIGIVAQQRVLEHRLAALPLIVDMRNKPTVPLNRTPLQACQTSTSD